MINLRASANFLWCSRAGACPCIHYFSVTWRYAWGLAEGFNWEYSQGRTTRSRSLRCFILAWLNETIHNRSNFWDGYHELHWSWSAKVVLGILLMALRKTAFPIPSLPVSSASSELIALILLMVHDINIWLKWGDERIYFRFILSPPHILQDWHPQISELRGKATAVEKHAIDSGTNRQHVWYVGGYHQISEEGHRSRQGSDG